MAARFLRWLFNLLSVLLSRRTVVGVENLPRQGPYILAANHLSISDIALVYGLAGGENVTGWAADKWARHPIFGPLVKLGGGIFIQRGEVDRGALGAATRWLEAGKIFGMAPEGTRSRTGGLARGKTGVAYLAHASGAPVVPVAISGSEKVFRTLLRLRRPAVTIRFGKPVVLPGAEYADRAAGLRMATDEVMCRIAAMLPPEYRGVYADHPRLKELLSAGST